jgi:type II secretory pathway pseudopilin PulG
VPFCAYCGSQVAETSYALCPSCGNPNNGAPRTQLGTGGSNTTAIVIVVIVLAVLAIPIAGILAAIAIPNYLTAVQRSKQKRTMADIRTIATDVEAHAQQHGTYPQRLDAEPKDGWGVPIRYQCVGDGSNACAGYFIASAGSDKMFEHNDVADYPQGATTKFAADIVFANGSFVQYPEGVTQ